MLDVDKMLTAIDIRPYRVWRKGEPERMGNRINRTSGACFTVSDAAFEDGAEKVKHVRAFLEANLVDATRISAFPGVESAGLDFAVSLLPEQFSKSCILSVELLKLAVAASLDIEFTHYAANISGAES